MDDGPPPPMDDGPLPAARDDEAPPPPLVSEHQPASGGHQPAAGGEHPPADDAPAHLEVTLDDAADAASLDAGCRKLAGLLVEQAEQQQQLMRPADAASLSLTPVERTAQSVPLLPPVTAAAAPADELGGEDKENMGGAPANGLDGSAEGGALTLMARKPENELLALPLVLHETLSTIADQLEMAEDAQLLAHLERTDLVHAVGEYVNKQCVDQLQAAKWLTSSDDLPYLRRILSVCVRVASCSVPVAQHLLAPGVGVAFVHVMGMAERMAFTDKDAPAIRVLCSHKSFGVKDAMSPIYNALGSLLVLYHQIEKPADVVLEFLADKHDEIYCEVLSTIVADVQGEDSQGAHVGAAGSLHQPAPGQSTRLADVAPTARRGRYDRPPLLAAQRRRRLARTPRYRLPSR